MRTETRTYTLYRITELSEEAKEKAYNQWLCNGYFYGWTHENRQTLDAFCERFGIVCRNWRYDACNYSYDYRSREKDCIDSLSGWRLMAYLMNNHWNDLYTPKYFWKGMKGRKSRIRNNGKSIGKYGNHRKNSIYKRTNKRNSRKYSNSMV